MKESGYKVLVSTKETQGQKKGDFSYVEEGQIVVAGFLCDRDAKIMQNGTNRELWDSTCGCGRCLSGLTHGAGTTTFKVIPYPTGKQAFKKELTTGLSKGGHPCPRNAVTNTLMFLDQVQQYSAGTILEMDVRNTLRVRKGANEQSN